MIIFKWLSIKNITSSVSVILHHCKLTAGDTLSWMLEKNATDQLLMNFYTLTTAFNCNIRCTEKYSYITSTISYRTLKINLHICYQLLDAACPYCFISSAFFLSKINLLLILRLKKLSVVCSVYLISRDWIKMSFFSVSCQAYTKTACAEFCKMQECSRQHKKPRVLKICFIRN